MRPATVQAAASVTRTVSRTRPWRASRTPIARRETAAAPATATPAPRRGRRGRPGRDSGAGTAPAEPGCREPEREVARRLRGAGRCIRRYGLRATPTPIVGRSSPQLRRTTVPAPHTPRSPGAVERIRGTVTRRFSPGVSANRTTNDIGSAHSRRRPFPTVILSVVGSGLTPDDAAGRSIAGGNRSARSAYGSGRFRVGGSRRRLMERSGRERTVVAQDVGASSPPSMPSCNSSVTGFEE